MYLLDTCLFSELTKKIPSEKVTQWLLARDEMLFYVSAMTFGEIKKGVEKVTDTARKKNDWGQLVAKSEKKGRILPTVDSLIAATAITHDLSIVTRNTKDFEGLGIELVNPWE